MSQQTTEKSDARAASTLTHDPHTQAAQNHRAAHSPALSTHDDGDAPTPGPARLRIGVFGGTFDPIHIGHLILAEEAWFQLGLDRVYMAPAGDPPHKQDRRLTPLEHRIAMCNLATAEIDYVTTSRVDADRPGPHYTSDMVRLVGQAAGENAEVYFLMGMDSLRDLPSWHEAAWLVENCRLVALSRHDVKLDWAKLEAALPGVRDQVIILDMPELEIASNAIQRRVRNKQTIRHQVPRAVEEYIYAHQLYANGSSAQDESAQASNGNQG
ncbi:MAG: nicotinate-nucleotide adenylyltransferase [Litorilinea sp.]